MNFRPTNDRLLVQRVQIPSLLPSGLVLPDTAKAVSQEAVVIAVGSGKVNPKTGGRIPSCAEPGDRILFNKYRGDEIELEGTPYVVIREDDIIVVIDLNALPDVGNVTGSMCDGDMLGQVHIL